MSRVKYTANNYCHKPIKGGERVEELIDAAAAGRLSEYLATGKSINVVADNDLSALHALARKGSGTKRDRVALTALLEEGVDVNILNFRGESALFRALVSGAHWMVMPLLEAGASLDVVNSKGVSLREVGKDVEAIKVFAEACELDQAVPYPAVGSPSRRRSL